MNRSTILGSKAIFFPCFSDHFDWNAFNLGVVPPSKSQIPWLKEHWVRIIVTDKSLTLFLRFSVKTTTHLSPGDGDG